MHRQDVLCMYDERVRNDRHPNLHNSSLIRGTARIVTIYGRVVANNRLACRERICRYAAKSILLNRGMDYAVETFHEKVLPIWIYSGINEVFQTVAEIQIWVRKSQNGKRRRDSRDVAQLMDQGIRSNEMEFLNILRLTEQPRLGQGLPGLNAPIPFHHPPPCYSHLALSGS